ncbi:MAG: cytochrome P450 [Actinomycetota bacterium]|nr:cytochrome P450 [Actinomycetota bacterium]
MVEPVEVGGWRYPPGVCLVPNAYLVHHDSAIYPEPYRFRPERFLDQSPGVGEAFELARRRDITIRPARGTLAVLGDRQPVAVGGG